MSSSEERVGGVEPETVEMYRARDFPEARWMECAPDTRHTIALYPNEYEVERFVEASALRLVEEELRQAREERDALAKDADEIAFALVKRTQQRDEARKAATGWVEDVSSMAARVDDMAGDLRACRAALDWYAKEDRYDVGRASRRPVVLADRGLLARRALAALSGVVPTPPEADRLSLSSMKPGAASLRCVECIRAAPTGQPCERHAPTPPEEHETGGES